MAGTSFPYSLVAIDLDGTLLNSSKQITENSIKTLRMLHENNVKIVLASGRMAEKMLGIYREVLDICDSFVVGYNGAKCLYVKSHTDHEQVFHLPVSNKLLEPLFKYCENLCLMFYLNGSCITLEKHKDSELLSIFAKITNNPTWEYIQKYEDIILTGFTNALVITDDEELADSIFSDLRRIFACESAHIVKTDCATNDHHQFYVEILNPEANKGKALQKLCDQLRIPREQVLVFGDGENDIEMFNFAGHGICMANACSKLKEVAKYISQYTNNDEGVHRELQCIYNSY